MDCNSSLETDCQEDIVIEVQKCWISQLPASLCLKILKDATSRLDNQQGIPRLLVIYLSTIEAVRATKISTPLYLYSWARGRIRMLEQLLETNVMDYSREVGLDMYNFYHRPNMSHNWGHNMDPELEMERLRLDERESSLVSDVITRCSFVTHLKIHTVADDAMLEVISRTCHCLLQLDLSFAKNVTDIGIEYLCCGKDSDLPLTLRNILLDGTSVTRSGVMLLLENIKNLNNIESSLVEDFLHSMQDFFARSGPVRTDVVQSYSLKSLSLCIRRISDNHKPSLLSLVSVLFPLVSDLQIHHVHPREMITLDNISNLKMLKSLMVGGVLLDHLVPCLTSIGQNLHTLRYLCYGGTSGKINFSVISDSCPNLETLAISGSCLVSRQDFGREKITRGYGLLAKLRHIHINVHAYIPLIIWTAVLGQCLELETVDLTSCELMKDETLVQVLDHSREALAKVVRLTVRGAHRGDVALTETTVSALNARCLHLKWLGDCFTWSLKSQRDLDCMTRGVL